MIYAVGAVWCAATAVKAVIVLARREAYIASWWDAGMATSNRKLGTVRTVIKLVTMLGLSAVCVLALIGVTAISELSAPKSKRR